MPYSEEITDLSVLCNKARYKLRDDSIVGVLIRANFHSSHNLFVGKLPPILQVQSRDC